MIVDQIKSGNVAAFKELFNDYFPILCCFAQRFISDDELCKDVAQEALLKYWENRTNFDNFFKVKGYLYVVTKNMALNIVKKNNRNSGISEKENYLPGEDLDIDNSIIEHEVMLMVRKAVVELPNRMRQIIDLSMMGAQNKDIAESLGIAEGTVHSLKKQAYKKLKHTLGKNFCYILLF